jgi:hypothetical protein
MLFLSNISHLRYLLMLCGFQSAGPREFFWQGHPLLDFPFGLRLHMSVSALRIRPVLQFYPAIRFAFHHNTASCRQADVKRRGKNKSLTLQTNNEAEYAALYEALKEVQELGASRNSITIRDNTRQFRVRRVRLFCQSRRRNTL